MKNTKWIVLTIIISVLRLKGYTQPNITNVSSNYTGVVNTNITISGIGFNTTMANNVVYFGPVKATLTSAAAGALGVTVPAGTTYGPVTVTDITTNLTGFSPKPFRQGFTSKNSIVASDIEAPVDFATGPNPVAVAVADLNGDGTSDVISANATGSSVSVLLNNTNTLSGISAATLAKQDFAVGDNPSNVIVGDFNEDGKLDLAVIYQANKWVTILTNTTPVGGALSFATAVNFPCSSNANAIATGDLDTDGKRDLVIANFGTNSLSILRNTSSGGLTSFAPAFDLVTGKAPNGLNLGDIDGDGKLEILVTNYTDSNLSVFKNQSVSGTLNSASFGAKVNFAFTGQPTAIFVANIDNDAKPDLIVASYVASTSTHNIMIARNAMTVTGAITAASFSAPVTIATGSQPIAVGMGDIDGDTYPDIAAVNYNNNTVSVYRNTSTGTVISTSTITAKIDFPTGNAPAALVIADLDRDGRPDIVTANDIDNTVSVLHNYNANSVPAPFPYTNSTASASIGSFVNNVITDAEWGQEAPPGYTVAGVSAGTVTGTTANAGRFVYFSTIGSTSPVVPVRGTLTFTANGSGTFEVQLISTYNMAIVQRKTFTMTASYANYNWILNSIAPRQEYILAFVFNGGNSSPNASAQFRSNVALNLQQAGMTGSFVRYRADATSLIGNKETLWAGYNDQLAIDRKKYLQHSAFSRMKFQTDATQIAIEYVRDSYDKTIKNLYPFSQTFYNKDFNAQGDTISGWHGINLATKVVPGKTYTISGLYTTNPKYVWYNSTHQPIGGVQTLTHGVAPGMDTLYMITAPANAASLGILVQRITDISNYANPINDTYLANSRCMIEEGAYGTTSPAGGTVPTPFVPFTGALGSRISGPAIFINNKLYNYYQVEGNDIGKVVQYVSDVLPPGMKTVEVMANGQGAYTQNNVTLDPHLRRSGNFLRAVYLPASNTTQVAASTVAPGSVLFIHDSILSGFNISSDAQNNVWMMKIMRDSTFGFAGDVYSEGYAGRILHDDTKNGTLLEAFAQKLAGYGVDNFWFQLGVNDYANAVSLPAYYTELNTLVERLKVLRPGATIYIQSIGPVNYEGPNSETFADNERAATGPTGNDFRDIQRAIATAPTHGYCRYVDFENLFPATVDNLADGIHPTDLGNELYAQGVKTKSTISGNELPKSLLAMYRSTVRRFVRSVESVVAFTAKGGLVPYTFSVVSGTVPAGLAFTNNGVLKGIATTDGTFPLRIRVTDANSDTASFVYNVLIKPVPSIMVAPAIIAGAKVSTFYTKTFQGALGYGKYTVASSGTIPPGMNYNATTKTLSGTPTTAGTYSFTLTATDHWNFTGATAYNFTVGASGSTVPTPTDNVVASASVNAAGELIVKSTLHDIYTQRVYLYYNLYIQQSGGPVFFGGKQVVIEAGELSGTANCGRLTVGVNAAFTLQMSSYAPDPAASDGKNFTYAATTNIPLTGNSNTYPAYDNFSLTPVPYTFNGHLYIKGSVQYTHTQDLYIYVELYLNSSSSMWTSKTLVIPIGQLSNAAAMDCGLLPVSGNFTVRIANYGLAPAQSDGRTFTYSSNTSFNLSN